jgi:hypothetical protein
MEYFNPREAVSLEVRQVIKELTGRLQTFHGGRLECIARLCSQSIRHLEEQDLLALDALRPLGHILFVDY